MYNRAIYIYTHAMSFSCVAVHSEEILVNYSGHIYDIRCNSNCPLALKVTPDMPCYE